MHTRTAVAVVSALAIVSSAQAGFGIRPPIIPAALAMSAEATVVGRVTDVEKDPIEADAYPAFLTPGAKKSPKVRYRIAIVKIEKALVGAAGVTQVRVGFTDRPLARPLNGPPPAAFHPTAGTAGLFFLARHPKADFYVPAEEFAPILSTDPMYDKVVAEITVVARAMEDPVAALKSRDQTERFVAAQTVLYRSVRQAAGQRAPGAEDLPDELNRLVLNTLAAMPWRPKESSGYLLTSRASRATLWYYVPARHYGFKAPTTGGDRDRQWDQATAAFLKENLDTIKLQRLDRKK